MLLGINSYTFMWSIGFQGANPAYPDRAARPAQPLTALGLLAKARELGVRLVQTGPNLLFEQLPEAEQQAFIDTAHAAGLTLEVGTRGLDEPHLVRQVALAQRLGATLIRTLPEINGRYAADARQLPEAVRPLLPLLERTGVRLAIETGRMPAADLRAALDEINSPLVGVVLDTVNSLAVPEGWRAVAQTLAPHTLCLHYKEFVIKRAWHMMGFVCEGAPAGQGQLDPAWLLDTLRASPHAFNVILEQWPPEQATLADTVRLEQAWAAESIPFLRQYIPN